MQKATAQKQADTRNGANSSQTTKKNNTYPSACHMPPCKYKMAQSASSKQGGEQVRGNSYEEAAQ